MGGSSVVKIVFLAIAPVVIFILLIGLLILYRRRPGRLAQADKWEIVGTPERKTSPCEACGHRPFPSQPPTNRPGPSDSPQSQGSLYHLPKTTQRPPDVAQPHFVETTTTIRRLSANKGRPDDVMQRVNSIASSLVVPGKTGADTLPLGGRTISTRGALEYASLEKSGGAVSMGERRLSVLTDPNEGFLNLRRVSVGGEEDVIRVRSASQSEESTMGPATIDFSEPMETIVSPSPSPCHPFSVTALSRGDFPSPPFKLSSPPRISRTSGNKTTRPDSIALAKNKVAVVPPAPVLTQPDPTDETMTSPKTATSVQALKSPPDTSASSGMIQSPQSYFHGWQGFIQPSHPTPPPGSTSKAQESETVLSPKTPGVDPVSVPLPDSPTSTPPPLKDRSPVDPYVAPATKAVDESLSQMSTEFQVSLTPPSDRPSRGPTSEPCSDRGLRTVNKKITFLADVVKENVQKRKAAQAEGSSIVAMASLEDRR